MHWRSPDCERFAVESRISCICVHTTIGGRLSLTMNNVKRLNTIRHCTYPHTLTTDIRPSKIPGLITWYEECDSWRQSEGRSSTIHGRNAGSKICVAASALNVLQATAQQSMLFHTSGFISIESIKTILLGIFCQSRPKNILRLFLRFFPLKLPLLNDLVV